MSTVINLSAGIVKNFAREKAIVLLLLMFPILMVIMAVASAPDSMVPLELDDTLVLPPPSGEEVAVILYSITALVFVTSITSFFVSFQLRSVVPRLRILGYSNFKIIASFVLVVVLISALSTIAITIVGTQWVSPIDWGGYIFSLFAGAIIFSTIGLIVAELVDSKELGLYLILTLGAIDTGFLENPIYSQRYNDPGLAIMPGNVPIHMLLRASFETSKSWMVGLQAIVLYEIFLIGIYLVVKRLFRSS
ncbi:MAG: hypothetical protein ACFFFG_17330 [Candidatus Thorarchaeota archaeon]